MNTKKRPYVLSIAGFDPSGGAGILADIKTYEAHRVTGLGVATCITYQNENKFEQVDWLKAKQIKNQIAVLFDAYKIKYVKIGLIENFKILKQIVTYLHKINPEIKIVWDPIFKASAGFCFHQDITAETIENICKKIYLITPNRDEIQKIYPDKTALEGAKTLSEYCNVYLKGGHDEENKGRDHLFTKSSYQNYRPKKIIKNSKHGSGCVFSAALTANLAKGFKLHKTCLKSKSYITKFLDSNNSLLGYHKF
ncbi:MAG: hydroxymethylpyrimidine/phosphomethylpyrimidine kinase [Bacteroidia bacterium]|nr:hydroxymethylpyrimidine/phosphomethylpyrimidine kinase [Bacteroidia bacterium]